MGTRPFKRDAVVCFALHAVFALLLCGGILNGLPSAAFAEDGAAAFAEGKQLYDKHCAQCHGVNGDAVAPAAAYYKPRPRDFTKGKYKVRSTLTGELPTDQDLRNAIVKGLAFATGIGAYTVMPPWPDFTDQQLNQLVGYLKTFSSDFADPEYNNPTPITIPSPPQVTEESITKGRQAFENNECIKCHGVYGRGDGASAPTLKDDWGHHIRAADLTKRWTFRGGGSREDIYRTISTGFNGTPMPSYADSLPEADRWDLVNYVYSLSRGDQPNYNKPDKPILVTPLEGEIPFDDFAAAQAAFATAEPGYIPLSGQVIEPGRALHPGVTEVQVRAIYNENEIAVMLQWHDLREDTAGSNAPDMEVPLFEPPAEEADSGAEAGGDPFADMEAEEADPFAGMEAAESDPFADMEADPFAEEEAGAVGGPGAAPPSKYSDAIAVQFPSEAPDGFKKPYFIFGDSNRSVDIWFLDLAKQEPKLYVGKGSGSLTEKDSQLTAHAKFENGLWTAIFKRPRSEEGSMALEEKSFVPVAFSVWEGFSEERGNKRALTSWYNLYLEPLKKESALLPMLGYGGGLLLLELLVIAWVRRRSRAAA